MQGHIYNGQYMHLFDIGKNEYFEQVLGVLDMGGSEALITASTTTDFLIPTGLRDKLTVQTGVSRIGTKSFVVTQRMVRADGAIVAASRTVMVAYDVPRRQSIAIPAPWREKMEKEGLIPEENA